MERVQLAALVRAAPSGAAPENRHLKLDRSYWSTAVVKGQKDVNPEQRGIAARSHPDAAQERREQGGQQELYLFYISRSLHKIGRDRIWTLLQLGYPA